MLLASTDEQLVDLVLDGDDEAFEVLFDRHVADAVWFARDVLGSWGDAEEAVRHSFAAAHAYLASRDENIEFRPWLHTILGNHCLSMLQARGAQPDLATVVDLDEWRQRRNRLGVAAPVASAAALRESVMAACGIGTGAAATGGAAPLLGGTLAKVAVVALLAGGAGVAEHATVERGPPAAATHSDRTEQVAASGGVGDRASAADRAPAATRDRSSEGESRSVRQLDERPGARGRSVPHRQAPGAGVPGATPPTPDPSSGAVPPTSAAPGSAVTAPSSTGGAVAGTSLPDAVNGAAGAVPPIGAAVRRVREAVSPAAPAPPGRLPEVRLPTPAAVTKIGDDLKVTTGKLTADVRTQLSRGANAPSQ